MSHRTPDADGSSNHDTNQGSSDEPPQPQPFQSFHEQLRILAMLGTDATPSPHRAASPALARMQGSSFISPGTGSRSAGIASDIANNTAGTSTSSSSSSSSNDHVSPSMFASDSTAAALATAVSALINDPQRHLGSTSGSSSRSRGRFGIGDAYDHQHHHHADHIARSIENAVISSLPDADHDAAQDAGGDVDACGDDGDMNGETIHHDAEHDAMAAAEQALQSILPFVPTHMLFDPRFMAKQAGIPWNDQSSSLLTYATIKAATEAMAAIQQQQQQQQQQEQQDEQRDQEEREEHEEQGYQPLVEQSDRQHRQDDGHVQQQDLLGDSQHDQNNEQQHDVRGTDDQAAISHEIRTQGFNSHHHDHDPNRDNDDSHNREQQAHASPDHDAMSHMDSQSHLEITQSAAALAAAASLANAAQFHMMSELHQQHQNQQFAHAALGSMHLNPFSQHMSHIQHQAHSIPDYMMGKVVVHACQLCKKSHVACDNERPCRRCVRMGKAQLCIDAEHKRRGRPRTRIPTVDHAASDGAMSPASQTPKRPRLGVESGVGSLDMQDNQGVLDKPVDEGNSVGTSSSIHGRSTSHIDAQPDGSASSSSATPAPVAEGVQQPATSSQAPVQPPPDSSQPSTATPTDPVDVASAPIQPPNPAKTGKPRGRRQRRTQIPAPSSLYQRPLLPLIPPGPQEPSFYHRLMFSGGMYAAPPPPQQQMQNLLSLPNDVLQAVTALSLLIPYGNGGGMPDFAAAAAAAAAGAAVAAAAAHASNNSHGSGGGDQIEGLEDRSGASGA